MAMITGLKEFRGVITVELDGAAVGRVRKVHWEKLGCRLNDDIDWPQTEDRLAQIQFADAYEAALSILDFAAKSRQEIHKKLIFKGYVRPAADAVVERLTQNGLLNDSDYAKRLAQTQLRRARGVRDIKNKLRAKGISEDDAEEALAGFDDDQQLQAARKAASSLSHRYLSLPGPEGRAKLLQALARRGFSWDIAREAVDEAFSGDDFADD